ncbi:hypothetical protein ACWGK6_24435 [Streptomyces violaceusniger]
MGLGFWSVGVGLSHQQFITGRKAGGTRVGPLHMNISRSKLALGDRDGALESLEAAWDVAPEMARVHPTSQELMRVLTSLHRRSNPRLTKLAKRAGVPF